MSTQFFVIFLEVSYYSSGIHKKQLGFVGDDLA